MPLNLRSMNKILNIMIRAQMEQEAPPEEAPADLPPESDDEDMGNVSDRVEAFDKEQIKLALTSIEELADVINARGDLFMTVNGVRGYKVALQYAEEPMPATPGMNKPDGKKKRLNEVYIFVYSEANARVIEFLVGAAQSNNFKKILGYTEHAIIVNEYSL